MLGEIREIGRERMKQERKEVGRVVRGRRRGAKSWRGALVILCDLG